MATTEDNLRIKSLIDYDAYKINRFLPQNQTPGRWITFAVPYGREGNIVYIYASSGVGMGAPYHGYSDRHKMIYRIDTGKLSFPKGGTLNANNRSEVEATIAGMIADEDGDVGHDKFDRFVAFVSQIYPGY